MRPSRLAALLAALIAVALPARRGAADAISPSADRGVVPSSPLRTTEEHPFAFVLDPTLVAVGGLSLSYGLGYGSGVGVDRPLPAAAAGAGRAITSSTSTTSVITQGVGVAAGVSARVSLFGEGHFGTTTPESVGNVGGALGARVLVAGDSTSAGRVTIGVAALRDVGGTYGASARVAASYDFGRVRVAGNVHLERAFRGAADTVDVLVLSGISYRVTDDFRLGAEYVGQDLEESSRGGAEGGARHYLGPTGALSLDRGRVQLVAGPSFALIGGAQRIVGRAAATIAF